MSDCTACALSCPDYFMIRGECPSCISDQRDDLEVKLVEALQISLRYERALEAILEHHIGFEGNVTWNIADKALRGEKDEQG